MSSSGSSFAFWNAYLLNEKATVFYNDKPMKSNSTVYRRDLYDYDLFLPEWVPINVKKGKAVEAIKPWRYNNSSSGLK